jgi:hypothetical protein
MYLLWLKQYRNPDIFSKLEDVYGQGVTTLRTVERWTKASTEVSITLNDASRLGWTLRYGVRGSTGS